MSRGLRSVVFGAVAILAASVSLVAVSPLDSVVFAAPAAPVISQPLNGITVSVGSPVFTGTALANSTVTVVVDGVPAGTSVTSPTGVWTFPSLTVFGNGPHTVKASANDGTGPSPDSSTVNFTVAVPGTGQTNITLASINDFHGRIDTNTVKWAGTVAQIVASAGGDDVAITGAGDLVGASLFASAVANDQPTIDVMNAIGLDASAVGNHEFDKGWPDLRDRIIGNQNADWDYLGANVYDSAALPALVPLLPEYDIITINGVDVGVIGAVTAETPSLVSPAGMVGVTIGDPVDAVNRVADQLTDGVGGNGEADVLVATFHEGAPSGSLTLNQNLAASAVFTDIVQNVSPEVDVLFNGHTHQAYVYSAPKPGGGTRPVLQTGNYGDFVGQVVLTVDTASNDVVSVTAANIARTTTADAALLEQYPGLQPVKTIVDTALAYAAVQGNVPVGRVSTDITTAYSNGSFGPTGYQAARVNANRDTRNAESTLGGLVANALLETLEPLGVDLPSDAGTIGVVNPGGLRAELFYPTSTPLNEGDGVVTYAEANGVLPFVNNLWTTHLTGAQVKTMLEQQWQRDANNAVPTRAYLQLGLSDNVSYTFDPAMPEGSRITSVTIDGVPINLAATYKIATFSFLTSGGDNFRIFTQGTSAQDSGLVDRDAWIAYLQARAAAPGIAPDYERRSAAVSPMPTSVTQGASIKTTLSYLSMTSLGTPASTTVDVSIGGVALGSAPVTFTALPNGNAAPVNGISGTAAIDVPVPSSVPAGARTLRFTVQPSGKVIDVPITVVAGPPSTSLTPLDPSRILDTRIGAATGDHLFEGIGIREPGTTLELQVTGRGNIPADAVGAVLNITATDGAGPGYVTVYPCGRPRPEASSVNYVADAPAPTTVIAAIGTGGKVCLYTALSSVHLIADVNGYVGANSGYLPLNPARLADSRTGASTSDGQFLGGGPRVVGSVWEIKVAGRGGVPNDATAAALNVTTTGATDTGYVTAWPCDSPRPLASSVNFIAGQDVPNAVTTKLSATGTVCLYVGQASTHLVVDVNGSFPPNSDFAALVPARLLDTRNAPTVDGQFSNGGPRQPGQVLELPVTGRGGVRAGASGVMLNLTATDASGTGYVTAWPCGGTPPNVSSLNFVASTPRANAVFVALSGTGKVCLVTFGASTELIVDVTGHL